MVAPPSKEAIRVSIQSLGSASLHWFNAYTFLLIAQNNIPSTRIPESEMGIFNELRNRYKDVPEFVLARLTEAQTACTEISKVLKDGRDTYQREEDENLHAMKSLW